MNWWCLPNFMLWKYLWSWKVAFIIWIEVTFEGDASANLLLNGLSISQGYVVITLDYIWTLCSKTTTVFLVFTGSSVAKVALNLETCFHMLYFFEAPAQRRNIFILHSKWSILLLVCKQKLPLYRWYVPNFMQKNCRLPLNGFYYRYSELVNISRNLQTEGTVPQTFWVICIKPLIPFKPTCSSRVK